MSSPHAREVVRYGDGRKSVIEYSSGTVARVGAASVVRVAGMVVEGRAKGHQAVLAVELLHQDLVTACLTPEGVRHATGTVTLRMLY
ncbi:hypothetical protein AB0K09_28965 [Streptomyces sp. NPDC049577]|uniref:hypothetical protein n=1 Tax=Streptomyces sp. NPDC049577 TaxID=3155153 RepID=UPI00344A21D4